MLHYVLEHDMLKNETMIKVSHKQGHGYYSIDDTVPPSFGGTRKVPQGTSMQGTLTGLVTQVVTNELLYVGNIIFPNQISFNRAIRLITYRLFRFFPTSESELLCVPWGGMNSLSLSQQKSPGYSSESSSNKFLNSFIISS
ncbi:hypothetical protein TNIN_387631 [Trichonephila inaurata madagascariensis]|uniref:Uncharacterized protein n=1 Tax=Trichonephila inaurata madagascariensis TaxID=2747483 RepID=A0A8X6YR23_9ARAC|nr:hypothetical protein TNIN_387631 [Trichonephila inaurata madagascariensis]